MVSKFFKILTLSERKRVKLLLGMMILVGLFDMAGVASIMPFMTILGDPATVGTNPILKRIFVFANNLGISAGEPFLFTLGIIAFLLLVFSLLFKAFATYLTVRFTYMCEYSIGKRLIEGYLHQPYAWFLNRHSADLGKSILSEVSHVILGGIVPIMNILSQGVVATALLFLLIIVDFKLAIIVGLILGAVYGILFKATATKLKFIGESRFKANQQRFTLVSEAFGASKEVKLGGLEHVFIDGFSRPALIYARHQSTAQIIGQIPRFVLEAIVFGGMILVVMYLILQGGNFGRALPIIGLYAYSGYKLMPALQAIYNSVTQLRYTGHSITAVYEDLITLKFDNSNQANTSISLNNQITLKNIWYSYPDATQATLIDLSLTIPARSIVGLVGATGSGKTTMVDLILGLLEAQEGSLEVDGRVINKHNLKTWQRAIGYVPQQIFLADDTVLSNIAFGVKLEEIDYSAVERAARIADIHEFVINELPLQYKSTIGERGVRLSGGQRQRIGIARALYHRPEVLILDEATSALDNLTEKAVMESLCNLGNDVTVIVIAHRLSTVKACDIIYLLDKGELKGQGNFEQLTRENEHFLAMTKTHL